MRIVVLAGGLSTEREVSISSGTLVAEALRSKGHEVVLLDVFMGYEENICDIDALFKQNYSFTDGNSIGDDVENTITNIKEAKENRLDKTSRYIGRNVIEICAEADITFLALHGGEGENGQLQATLDLFGIKYTGSGYLGSALAMNKGLTKSVFMQKNINTPSGELYKNENDLHGICFRASLSHARAVQVLVFQRLRMQISIKRLLKRLSIMRTKLLLNSS